MGELILCNQQIAALPYYIESVSLNVYSLEELSYYIENNLYLMEHDFMDEELCTWVEQELKLKETAENLREIMRGNGTLSEFVLCILHSCGYCGEKSIQQIGRSLQEMENKSEFECGKIRADRYMENQKYVCGIFEYRKLLEYAKTAENAKTPENQNLIGAVWHNMGTAYARLFLFDKAAEYYGRAFDLNQNEKSLDAALLAYRCAHDERGFQRKAAAHFLSETETAELSAGLTQISRMEEIENFEKRIDELFLSREQQGERSDEITQLVGVWKDEYRKNCKI